MYIKIRLIIFFIILVYSSQIRTQEKFILDSLYEIGFADLSRLKTGMLQEEIHNLNKDYGLSAGVSVNNYDFDLNDNGFSTRMRLDMKVLGNGWKSNQMKAEENEYKLRLNELKGDREEMNHNYSIYYDYVIYLFNKEKDPQLKELLSMTQELEFELTNLYYNKLAPFEDIISARSTIIKYQSLLNTVNNYNDIFSEIILGYPLPDMPEDLAPIYELNIDKISKAFELDKLQEEKTIIEKSIVNNKHRRLDLPNLSLSGGYRIRNASLDRGKMFFSLNFTKSLAPNKEKAKDMEIELIENRNQLDLYQKEKELINLYYEYQYKLKQYNTLLYKKYYYDERARINKVKKDILKTVDGVLELEESVDSVMVHYEMIEVRQQMFIKLLQIKKLIYPLNIGDYIKPIINEDEAKFAGNRFHLIQDGHELSQQDLNILESNEIQVITTSEILKMREIVLVPAKDFTNRLELEEWVKAKINTHPERNFLFMDLEEFKNLELRTLDNPVFTLSEEE